MFRSMSIDMLLCCCALCVVRDFDVVMCDDGGRSFDVEEIIEIYKTNTDFYDR